MNFFESHNVALRTEFLKLRRTGMLWLCMGAALFVPLLSTIFAIALDRGNNGAGNPWDLFIQTCFTSFTSFFFPLFLVVMTTRLVYVEHRSDTWKLMETQPVSKLAIFLAKWEVAALISLACLIFLLLFTLLGGFIVSLNRDEVKMGDHSITWSIVLSFIMRMWIASFAIISIQYFLGLLIKSFSWPLSIGLIGIIAGSILSEVGVWSWWPYSATLKTTTTFDGSQNSSFLLFHEKLAIAWTVFLLFLGYQYFRRKSLKHAYLKPAGNAVAFGVAIALFIGLSWWLTKPTTLDRYNRTVIAGTIKSVKPVNHIVIARAPAFDTVMLIPVQDGKFHAAAMQDVSPGMYALRAGNYKRVIFLGRNDSLYIDLELGKERNEVDIKGTRTAENAYLEDGRGGFYTLENFAYNFKPSQYAAEVMDAWKNGVERIEDFKTRDNIALSEDFKTIQRKLLAVKLLTFVDHYYPEVHAVYYPNDTLKYPKYIDKLRKEVSIDDTTLTAYQDFQQYYSAGIRKHAGRNDSLYFTGLKSIPNTQLRDALLYSAVEQDVFRIRDSARRASAFQFAMGGVSQPVLRRSLEEKWGRMRSLQRDRKAPLFAAEAINAMDFDMSRLANRYIVIDVWATWCGPCKKEAPFFAELAEKYTSENVAFVSVSIDEDKNAWRMYSAGNNSKVLQLWAKDAEHGFARAFNIQAIPRFMFISPRGTIINADMPPPSDPEFEAILQKEIPQLQYYARF